MSGICGFITEEGKAGSPGRRREILEEMASRLAHRGPGGSRFYLDEFAALAQLLPPPGNATDRPGAPPASGSPPSPVLLFDGQLYNLPSLRRELRPRTAGLAPSSYLPAPLDQIYPLLVALCKEHGDPFPARLRGAFAFALWDRRYRSLLLARDRFGIRPLYYSVAGASFIFASEAKALLAHPLVKPALNEAALPHYLTYQYFPGEESAFKNIFHLPPATTLKRGPGREPKAAPRRYWHLRFNSHPPQRPLSSYVERTRCLLQESVQLHAETALPLGAFLSSGVDSSLVAALLTVHRGRIPTFSVDCADSRYNELGPARETAAILRSFHRELLIGPEQFWEALPRALWHQDEPVADPSAIALYLACRRAAAEVKVVLSGEGADELFAGYNIYHQPAALAPLQRLPAPLQNLLRRLSHALPEGFKGKNYLRRATTPLEQRYFGNALIFSETEKRRLLNHHLFPSPLPPPGEAAAPYYRRSRFLDDLSRMQHLDFFTWLPGDILAKADRMAAASSLELRLPFLDHRLVEMASQIPPHYRIRGKDTKYILREAATAYLLPRTAFRPKLGFPIPTAPWIRRPFYHRLQELFTSPTAAHYFNSPYLLEMLARHRQGRAAYDRRLWTIAIFLLWHRLYLE